MKSKCLVALLLFIAIASSVLLNCAIFGAVIEIADWFLVKGGFSNTIIGFRSAFDLGSVVFLAAQLMILAVPRRFSCR